MNQRLQNCASEQESQRGRLKKGGMKRIIRESWNMFLRWLPCKWDGGRGQDVFENATGGKWGTSVTEVNIFLWTAKSKLGGVCAGLGVMFVFQNGWQETSTASCTSGKTDRIISFRQVLWSFCKSKLPFPQNLIIIYRIEQQGLCYPIPSKLKVFNH